MKSQLTFSICASVGLHIGGALLVPWPEGHPAAREGVATVTLEISDVTSADEASAATVAPPATPASHETKVNPPVVAEAPPVELKSEAASTNTRPDSPPATSKTTASATTAPESATRPEPVTQARTAKNAGARGGPSGGISGVRYRERAALSYPASALRQRIGGTVVLLVNIDEKGRATGVIVRQSSGNADLDGAAITCARQSTYEPFRVQGVAEPCSVEAPFYFDASTRRR